MKEAKRDKTDPSRKLMVCPVCGKATLKQTPSSLSGWLTAPMYFCTREECNYSGYLYAEIVVDEEDESNDESNENIEMMEEDEAHYVNEEEHPSINGKVVKRSD